MVEIKREKRKGKFTAVAREKGKIIASKKLTKDFTITKARRIFKHNKTFTEGLSKRKLVSRPDFTETTDKRRNPRIPKKIPFRVVVSGLLKDGTIIAASSMAKLWDNFEEAKAEAEKSFLERLAFEMGDDYDADEGMKSIREVKSIRTEVIIVR